MAIKSSKEEETGKDGGIRGNIQELECMDGCPGCCGIPAMDPTEQKGSGDKKPTDGPP